MTCIGTATRICSPQQAVLLRADNPFGVPPGPATLTAYGWMAWLKQLSPGRHTLLSETTFTDGSEPHVISSTVNVVRRHRDAADGGCSRAQPTHSAGAGSPATSGPAGVLSPMAERDATIAEGDEPDEPASDNSLGRLLALSDGVFAIAMTLLALDLRLPDLGARPERRAVAPRLG